MDTGVSRLQLGQGMLGGQKKHLACAGGGEEAGRVQSKLLISAQNLRDEGEGPGEGQEKASWAARRQVALARAAWTREGALTDPGLFGEPDHADAEAGVHRRALALQRVMRVYAAPQGPSLRPPGSCWARPLRLSPPHCRCRWRVWF